MEELQKQIIEWAEAKRINNPDNQRLKVLEETGEVAGAILRGNRDEILMELGDVIVTIIILHNLTNVKTIIPIPHKGYTVGGPSKTLSKVVQRCERDIILLYISDLAGYYNSTLEECLTMAWNKIKDRQGKTVNGTFIKNE